MTDRPTDWTLERISFWVNEWMKQWVPAPTARTSEQAIQWANQQHTNETRNNKEQTKGDFLYGWQTDLLFELPVFYCFWAAYSPSCLPSGPREDWSRLESRRLEKRMLNWLESKESKQGWEKRALECKKDQA